MPVFTAEFDLSNDDDTHIVVELRPSGLVNFFVWETGKPRWYLFGSRKKINLHHFMIGKWSFGERKIIALDNSLIKNLRDSFLKNGVVFPCAVLTTFTQEIGYLGTGALRDEIEKYEKIHGDIV